MVLDRAAIIDEQFIKRVKVADFPALRASMAIAEPTIDKATLLDLFDSQIKSRLLDITAREMKRDGTSYYTIGSSGHEGNAAFGKIFTPKDMAFLHYRSGAFYVQRSKHDPKSDAVQDILLSLAASADDPISGGRHKVFGSVRLNIPPQTSTIASHLPKALGAALSITRAKELKLGSTLEPDALILCSFGDASLNHAVAQTTFNACGWIGEQSYPIPLVLICEDNGIGISVPTPPNWVRQSMSARPHIHYMTCDGLNIVDCYNTALEAMHIARTQRRVVFIHMTCVRLLGHAGSDIESQYRNLQDIEQTEADDPLLHTAAMLYREGWMTSEDIITLYQSNQEHIQAVARSVVNQPKLTSASAVMSSLLPHSRHKPRALPSTADRKRVWGDAFKQMSRQRNLSQQINIALTDLMLQYPNMLIFGEDVAKKGGVYHVTADLEARFGKRRVFNTLLDETTILGTAIGLAHNNFLPVPEIQFLAYLHNAEDQLRGEASTLSFFSNGQYQNPMMIRIAALAYQKGFGGHFHNDNSITVLRDLPGVIVACPSNGPDAARLLRTCMRLAHEERRVVVFLEPIALYMTKDLHVAGDNGWLFKYPDLEESISFGSVSTYGSGETAIITYANGYYLSRQAAKILQDTFGISVKIIDLHWLSPLPTEAISKELSGVTRVLIVDEGRRSGSISEALMAWFMEQRELDIDVKRMTGEDCFIPLGEAWKYLLPSRDAIVDVVRNWVAVEQQLPQEMA